MDMKVLANYFLLLVSTMSPVMVQARSVGIWEALRIMFLDPNASKETTQQVADEHSQDILVIGAGLGRTGTTSFVEALKQLGLHPYHMVEGVADSPGHDTMWELHANTNGSKTMEIIAMLRRDGFNATTDFPVCLLYQELMEAYPTAKVVLTVRNDGDGHHWAQSAMDTILRLPHIFERVPFCWISKLRSIVAVMDWSLYTKLQVKSVENKDDLALAYNTWEAQVRQTVPAEKLLVFAPRDGWRPLCEFLSPLKESIQQRCQTILESELPYPYENAKKKMKAIFFVFGIVATICEYAPIWASLIMVFVYYRSRRGVVEKQKAS